MKVINLTGRIDSNNAEIVESEISSQLAENPGETPIFDATNLEYISSAGLRVLLKFRKKSGAKLEVLNVSDEVYNIFNVTGFTELFSVIKKPREIPATNLEIIGEGAVSTVYRINADTIIKVYNKQPIPLTDIERERLASREALIRGIPTAIPFEIVKYGQHYGLIYEMIDAETMSATLKKQPERLEELSVKAGQLLKKLHTTEFEPGTFPDARDDQHSRVKKAFDMKLISAEDKAIVDGIIDRIPYRNTFIHSDFHTRNIMVRGDDLILIDIGGAKLGNPINDLLVLYMYFAEMVSSAIAEPAIVLYERKLGLDRETIRKMWKIIMREYFGTSDKDTLQHYSDIMSLYASFMMLELCAMSVGESFELSKLIAGKYMSRLREASDTLRPIEGI
ncbi:MAG: phosphotransferase [Synergistaceae bacterium]|nr:phosphotransferase [Synergistaceae bacterium]